MLPRFYKTIGRDVAALVLHLQSPESHRIIRMIRTLLSRFGVQALFLLGLDLPWYRLRLANIAPPRRGSNHASIVSDDTLPERLG